MIKLLVILVICISSAYGQVHDDFQAWSWLKVQGELDNPYLPESMDNRLLGSMEFHYRLKQDATDFQTLILRPMAGYKLNNNNTVWLGYAYAESNVNGKIVQEHRMFQMITYSHQFGNKQVVFVGKTRLEERFFENSENVNLRLRQMLKLSFNLFKIKESQVSLYIQNEYFLNLNKTDVNNGFGFEQNRTLLGLGMKTKINDVPVQINIGYMNNITGSGKLNHGVNLGVSITIPSKKKNKKKKKL